MTNPKETDDSNKNEVIDWLRKGLRQSAATYAQLRSSWLSQKSKSSLTHLLEAHLSLRMIEDNVDPEHSVTAAAPNTSSSVHWADLSASFIWPRLINNRKHSVRRPVPPCLVRTSQQVGAAASGSTLSQSDEETATLEQALRAYFPPTILGESVQCDLIVNNPSDRPVFVQPVLLDTVYAIRTCDRKNNRTESCENQTNSIRESRRTTEPLVSFLHALGVPASMEHAIKVRVSDHHSAYYTSFNLVYTSVVRGTVHFDLKVTIYWHVNISSRS